MQSFGLFTDLYQLTMAYGYWRLNMHEREAIFHLFYRTNPFNGNYAISCGMGTIQEFLQQYGVSTDDVDYLASLRTSDNLPLFSTEFLLYLKNLRFTANISAVPEGTIVGPNQPLLRVQGGLMQCQLLEALLLSNINFQTLIATKASRIVSAANGDDVIELGMRSASGTEGALSSSRAAYIGGCIATSNVLAGKKYNIPIRGTHAHSWVAAFPSELEAFHSYVKVMPENPILLVDTYNTIEGIRNAICVGKKLKANNNELFGIRIDSGDLFELSCTARALLDAAGFHNTKIIASNNLDETKISKLKAQGAPITIWGVGSSLVNPPDSGSLNGVYKLSAICDQHGNWKNVIKISEETIKTSLPGKQQIRRFYSAEYPIFDIIYDVNLGIDSPPYSQDLAIGNYDSYCDLLVPIVQNGQPVNETTESVREIRDRCTNNLAKFKKYYSDEKIYPIGLEEKLYKLKNSLINTIKLNKKTPTIQRKIRSFAIRNKLLKKPQEEKFTSLWKKWGLSNQEILIPETIFHRTAPCLLEIGYGNGKTLADLANQHPEYNFIGIEVFKPGIMSLLREIQRLNLTNIKLYQGDAITILENCIPQQSLHGVQIFFPDPWPKLRHHKRRLIQPNTISLITSKLKQHGIIHLATDWEDYAHHMMTVLSAEPNLSNIAGIDKFAQRSILRPLISKFEHKAQLEGRKIWELQFIKIMLHT